MEITSYEVSSTFETGLIIALKYFKEEINKFKGGQGLFEGISNREKLKSYETKRLDFHLPPASPENPTSSSPTDLKYFVTLWTVTYALRKRLSFFR